MAISHKLAGLTKTSPGSVSIFSRVNPGRCGSVSTYHSRACVSRSKLIPYIPENLQGALHPPEGLTIALYRHRLAVDVQVMDLYQELFGPRGRLAQSRQFRRPVGDSKP